MKSKLSKRFNAVPSSTPGSVAAELLVSIDRPAALPPRRLHTLIIFIFAFGALCASAFSADTWSPGLGWKPVWADEFNGTSVDPKNWAFDLGQGDGWGNNELQIYTNSNASVQNGELVISVIKNPNGTYTSSRLKTQGLHSWKYGKMAARIRLPYGQGIWPAFWMLGDNISTVGWPKCGEIDIMEVFGGGENRDDTLLATLLWYNADIGSGLETSGNRQAPNVPFELPDPSFFKDDYHVFEVEWSNTEIVWKLDSVEFFRRSIDANRWPALDEFHNPFYMLLNVAVGGNLPVGYPDASTVFPQTMNVDWVRVYTREIAGPDFNGDGKPDLVGQNTSTGERGIWFMNGATYVGSGFLSAVPVASQIAGTGDFNADGKPDLVWQNTSTGERGIWFMNGATPAGSATIVNAPVAVQIAGVGDFNADGKPDLVWQNTATGDRGVWFMNGATYVGSANIGNVAAAFQIAGVGDFNADGKPDFVWQNTATGDRGIWFMNGTTYTGSANIGNVATTWQIAGTGDFNADGKLDLVGQNTTTGDRVILFLNGATSVGSAFIGNVPVAWRIRN